MTIYDAGPLAAGPLCGLLIPPDLFFFSVGNVCVENGK